MPSVTSTGPSARARSGYCRRIASCPWRTLQERSEQGDDGVDVGLLCRGRGGRHEMPVRRGDGLPLVELELLDDVRGHTPDVDVGQPHGELAERQQRKFTLLTVLRNRVHEGHSCPVVALELLELAAVGDAQVVADPLDGDTDLAVDLGGRAAGAPRSSESFRVQFGGLEVEVASHITRPFVLSPAARMGWGRGRVAGAVEHQA